jgi:hypothetical protein
MRIRIHSKWIWIHRSAPKKVSTYRTRTLLFSYSIHIPTDQCCGSGMFIPDPGSWFLPIPDPGSKNSNKRVRWKKICYTFFCSHKYHKIEYYVLFEMVKKKIWANFQRIVEVFTQKIFNMLSNIWIWDPGSEIRDPGSEIRDPRSGIRDPGSEIRDPEKTYSGSRIQGSKKHRIPDPGSATLLRIRIRGSVNFNYRPGLGPTCTVHLTNILQVKKSKNWTFFQNF